MSTAALGMSCSVIPVEYGLMTTGLLALDGVVALDALLGVVAGLAFLDDEAGAADAAITLVEHVEIIGHAVGDRYPGPGKRAGPIGEQRNVDAVRRLRRRDRGARRGHDRQAESKIFQTHWQFLLLELRRLSAGASI